MGGADQACKYLLAHTNCVSNDHLAAVILFYERLDEKLEALGLYSTTNHSVPSLPVLPHLPAPSSTLPLYCFQMPTSWQNSISWLWWVNKIGGKIELVRFCVCITIPSNSFQADIGVSKIMVANELHIGLDTKVWNIPAMRKQLDQTHFQGVDMQLLEIVKNLDDGCSGNCGSTLNHQIASILSAAKCAKSKLLQPNN